MCYQAFLPLFLILPSSVQLGGIGFVHYNMPLEQQVQTIQRVKQQAVGFASNPSVNLRHNPQVHNIDAQTHKVRAATVTNETHSM